MQCIPYLTSCCCVGAFTQYFPDRFVRKEIHNLEVRCYGHDNGCSWRGKLKDLEVIHPNNSNVNTNGASCAKLMLLQLKLFIALLFLQDHFKQCQFSTEECKFCGLAIHLLEMSTHMANCPKAGKLCPLADLGCTAVQVSQLLNPVY